MVKTEESQSVGGGGGVFGLNAEVLQVSEQDVDLSHCFIDASLSSHLGKLPAEFNGMVMVMVVSHVTAVIVQVLADTGQVGLQSFHAGMLVVMVTEDVVQVEVQDIGVEAADLHMILVGVHSGHQSRTGVFLRLAALSMSCHLMDNIERLSASQWRAEWLVHRVRQCQLNPANQK